MRFFDREAETKAKAYFEKNGGLKSNWVIRHQALSLKDM